MKSKLLACITAAALCILSASAFASFQCTAVNPVKGLHWVWTAPYQSTAFNQVQSRCLSVTSNPANCHISCINLGGPVYGAASNTCVVRDLAGRTWNWTSGDPNYSCRRATQACVNWHLNHGIVNGVCNVVS